MLRKLLGPAAFVIVFGAVLFLVAIEPRFEETRFPLRVSPSQNAAERGELLARWLEEAPSSIEVEAKEFGQMRFSRTLVLLEIESGGWGASVKYVGEQFGPDYSLFWASEWLSVGFMRSLFSDNVWNLEENAVVLRSTMTADDRVVLSILALILSVVVGVMAHIIVS